MMITYALMLAAAVSGTTAWGAPPSGVGDLVLVAPFTLAQPYTYTWLAEQPEITEGTIIVVEVEPAPPRQVGMPVLYVGAMPAERINWGPTDERLIVVVPGHPDLSATPIYWGSDKLPEQVDAAFGSEQLALAIAAGITPHSGGAAIAQPQTQFSDGASLYRHLADLLVEHAPGDAARGDGWKLDAPM